MFLTTQTFQYPKRKLSRIRPHIIQRSHQLTNYLQKRRLLASSALFAVANCSLSHRRVFLLVARGLCGALEAGVGCTQRGRLPAPMAHYEESREAKRNTERHDDCGRQDGGQIRALMLVFPLRPEVAVCALELHRRRCLWLGHNLR